MARASTHEVAVPGDVHAASDLADADYTYACQLDTASSEDRSAEEWARAVFEGAPPALRRFIVGGWIAGLGLRLGPRRSPSHVLGWTIVSATPKVAVLGVSSFMMTARLVVSVNASSVVHATFVRYDRPLAKVVWPVAAVIHQRVIPYLLGHAAGQVTPI